MSGKYMKIKKVFIPTLTALIIASQLTGCGAASQSELLRMINNQQSICIEVAVPNEAEQGTEVIYDWKELASLENYPEFRLAFEDALGITAFGSGGKNGTVYVDLEGNHTDNSTFYYAMMNKKFREQIGDTDTNAELVKLAYDNYADVENDSEAKLAYINAYFNIFEDNETNYYNGSSSVTRAEFLSALYRAGNPVTELSLSDTFKNAVDPDGECEHTVFAEQLLEHSYLGLEDKSLNTQTFTGEITRAEAVYTIVRMFYAEEYAGVTGKENAFSDAKNGGDIASKQKFIETDKKTKETTHKDYWMSYELQYAINNPDKGMPDDLYKAMVVAKQVGLINTEECRWDEAITKNEALNFILRVYEGMDSVTNADRGEATGEAIDNGAQGDGVFNNPYANYTKNDPSLEGYEVTITETLDTQMYVIKESDLYKLDNEKAGKINVMEYGIYVTATGKTSNGWYEVLWGTTKGYLPADVLSTENPLQPIDMNEVNPETGKTTQENLDAFYDAMNDPEFQAELEEEIGPGLSDDIPVSEMPDYDKTPAW